MNISSEPKSPARSNFPAGPRRGGKRRRAGEISRIRLVWRQAKSAVVQWLPRQTCSSHSAAGSAPPFSQRTLAEFSPAATVSFGSSGGDRIQPRRRRHERGLRILRADGGGERGIVQHAAQVIMNFAAVAGQVADDLDLPRNFVRRKFGRRRRSRLAKT